MSDPGDPSAPARQPQPSPPPQISPLVLLQRLIGEVQELRMEFNTEMRPTLVETSKTLRSLEAYIMVGFANRLADELKEKLSSALDAERKKERRVRRLRSLASGMLIVLLLVMLALEIHDDVVSYWIRRIVDGVRPLSHGS